MKNISVKIGSIENISGRQQDFTQEVVFAGEELGQRSILTGDNDSRGVVETLYRAANGRLIVHVKDWSHWQGEPTSFSLQAIEEADLQPGGRFLWLGYESGYGRPLTLDEALEEDDAL